MLEHTIGGMLESAANRHLYQKEKGAMNLSEREKRARFEQEFDRKMQKSFNQDRKGSPPSQLQKFNNGFDTFLNRNHR